MSADTHLRHGIKHGDLARIVTLHSELYDTEHGYDHTFEAYVAEPLAQCIKRDNPRERIWLVEHNGVVEGSIAVCESSPTTAQLRWFLLSPELRGQGWGSTLMNSVEAFCAENHYQSLELWTVKGLEAARRIYCRHGFELAEEVSHLVWGSLRTEQRFHKNL